MVRRSSFRRSMILVSWIKLSITLAATPFYFRSAECVSDSLLLLYKSIPEMVLAGSAKIIQWGVQTAVHSEPISSSKLRQSHIVQFKMSIGCYSCVLQIYCIH